MKHTIYNIAILSALCWMVFVGCRKEDVMDLSKYKTIITVQSSQNKTHYNSADGNVHWDAGDQISVARGITFATEPFTLIDTTDGVARFGGDISGVTTGSYFAIYPAQDELSISSAGVLTCEVIKTYQTLTESTFGKGNNTAVGYNDATTMQFRNVGALAKMAVRGDVAIKSIKIINNDRQPLSGLGNIDVLDNLKIQFDVTNSVDSVVAQAPTSAGIDLESPKWFYIVLPPCTLHNYTIVVTDVNGGVHRKFYFDTTVSVQRSHVVLLGAFDVNESIPSNPLFSVDALNHKVKFAHGNLHCNASENPHTWWFAEHQYTTQYTNTQNFYQATDVELFYWGPDDNSFGENRDYSGHNTSLTSFNWGSNPAIVNLEGGSWRTLSKDEWQYIISSRSNTVTFNSVTSENILYVHATVANVPGVILFPDGDVNIYVPGKALSTTNSTEFSSNVFTAEEWDNIFESEGCVFLPAAGDRNGSNTYYGTQIGNYWSSTPMSTEIFHGAYLLRFNSSSINAQNAWNRSSGYSVRLVKNQ